MDAETRARFWPAVLQGLGLGVTPWRVAFLEEWQRWEGTGAKFNPLATTRTGPPLDPANPYWNVNGGNPVKNYRDIEAGVQATVETLRLSFYETIRQTLFDQAITDRAELARELSEVWGTQGFATVVRGGGRHWSRPHRRR